MSFFGLAFAAVCLMAAVCWASNIWPGNGTWTRAAIGRAIWWGAPIGAVVWVNGAPAGNAAIMAAAAWVGAWMPHEALPNIREHWTVVLAETVIVLCRTLAMLALPAAVFLWCGAYWPAMVWAAVSAAPCMQAALGLPHGWPGLRTSQQVAGVLFGACMGFWLAVAVWAPENSPDLLP